MYNYFFFFSTDVNKVVHPQSLQNSVIKEETCVQNTVENVPVNKNKKSVKSNKEGLQKISIKVILK